MQVILFLPPSYSAYFPKRLGSSRTLSPRCPTRATCSPVGLKMRLVMLSEGAHVHRRVYGNKKTKDRNHDMSIAYTYNCNSLYFSVMKNDLSIHKIYCLFDIFLSFFFNTSFSAIFSDGPPPPKDFWSQSLRNSYKWGLFIICNRFSPCIRWLWMYSRLSADS